MKNLKAIVFDVGNVLIAFNPTAWLLKTYDDMETIKVLYQEVFSSEEWKKLDKGVLTPEEAVASVVARIPAYEKEVQRILFHWESFLIEEMPISVRFLKQFKAMGYELYALSNYPQRGFENTALFYPFFDLFDDKVVSYAHEEMKPEEEIYKILLKTYDLRPEECLFIDDTLANVETARALGMKALHFFHDNQLMDLYLALEKAKEE